MHVSTATLRKKFGNQRLDVIARMVARATTSASGGCALAEDPFQSLFSARPSQPDPEASVPALRVRLGREWIVPVEAPDPGDFEEAAPVLQLRPTRAALGRKRFRVVGS